MSSRTNLAVEYFNEGYNCAQAVFAAFAGKYGIDKNTALRIASSFGAGIGRMRGVCGAASGMFMVVGLETGAIDSSDQDGKAANYEKVRELADRFKERAGSLICSELLGLDEAAKAAESHVPEARTPEYYQKRPCVELVRIAAEILIEEYGE